MTIWAASPRPRQLDPTAGDIYLQDRHLGRLHPTSNFEPHRFVIPRDLATQLADDRYAAQLRIESNTWSPSQVIDGGDPRELGTMIDRITVDE